MEIVVIGGGVGGLTAALAMAQGGHRVQVLERALRFAQPGPALRLAPNATAILSRLGLLDQVLDLGARPRRAVLCDLGSGTELAELILGAPLTARYGNPYLVVGRADLLSMLADACVDTDVELRPGREVISVDQSRFASSVMGGPVVTCASGQMYSGDAVLAADGSRSVVRALLGGGEPSRDGWAVYRDTVPADALAGDTAGDAVVAWTGPDAHFSQFPVRIGEVYEQVAVFRSHRYPLVGRPHGAGPYSQGGPSPLAGPSALAGTASPGGAGQGADDGAPGVASQGGDDSAWGGAGQGAPGGAGQGADDRAWGAAGQGADDGAWGGPDELDDAFSWATGPVRAAVGRLRRDRCWRMLDRVPAYAWAADRIALLGDAVHPMPAYLAQAACQAIEDAGALADALADCQGPGGVAAALAAYQARRAPRALRVSRARQVWEYGPFPGRPADDYAAVDWLYLT